MSKKKRTRTLVRELLRTIPVNDGDVVLIKSNTVLDDTRVFESMSRAFASTDRTKCIICKVDSFDDLSILDEEQMNELGWQRIETHE